MAIVDIVLCRVLCAEKHRRWTDRVACARSGFFSVEIEKEMSINSPQIRK